MTDFRGIFEAVPGYLVVFDRDFRIVAATDAYLALSARRRDDIVGRIVFDAFPDNPDDPDADGVRNLRTSLERVLDRRVADTMALQKYDVQDPETGVWSERYWEPLNVPVLDTDGEVTYIIQRVEEVTDAVLRDRREELSRRALRSSQDQLEAAQRMARLGSWEYTLDDGTLSVSDGFRHLFGLGATEAVADLDALIATADPDDRPRLRAKFAEAVAGRETPDIEYRMRTHGEPRVVQCRCMPVWQRGVVTGVRATIQDITALKQLESERTALLADVEVLARTDQLTDIANRRAWDEGLLRELARAAWDRTPLVIALVDFDHFKDYNDTHGHQTGDALLKDAAAAWRATLRATDLLARYGGEEFALLLPNCAEDEAHRALERLAAATPGGQTVSVGLAVWDGEEPGDALVARADAALYGAKQAGRNAIVTAPPAVPGHRVDPGAHSA